MPTRGCSQKGPSNKFMNEIETMCENAMQVLKQKESFKEEDFYDHLRGHGFSANEMIAFCKKTFRDHLKVGSIKRCIGGYTKAD
jgi:hypothetical protein